MPAATGQLKLVPFPCESVPLLRMWLQPFSHRRNVGLDAPVKTRSLRTETRDHFVAIHCAHRNHTVAVGGRKHFASTVIACTVEYHDTLACRQIRGDCDDRGVAVQVVVGITVRIQGSVSREVGENKSAPIESANSIAATQLSSS